MTFFLLVVLVFVLVLNAGYAVLWTMLLRRRQPVPRGLIRAVWIWVLVMDILLALQAFAPEGWNDFLRTWLYLPLAVQMIWNILFILLLMPGMILLVLAMGRLRPVKDSAPLSEPGLTRRKFVYFLTCGAAPATAIGMGVHGTLTSQALKETRMTVPISGLPAEMEGFTIAHLSDLHSGLYCGPDRLKRIGDLTNDLKPDLIVISGDIINHSMTEFPDALAMMRRLESPNGLFLCEGNHDHPSKREVVLACLEERLQMLYSTAATVMVGGQRLIVAGLPWMNSDFHGSPEIVAGLYPERQPGDVRVLLAHHPHLFDYAASADLVLSGHTHGGQIMLGEDLGLGPIFFKYWSGLYRQGTTSMVVSNGCGDWFPCRIGAPAEVSLLRLTAG